ncbi:pentapeptide repeat-containing protein [Desulfovibrio sp. UCD-KL4C]|uniref:pentapeptide repeat-containing protein n=1 Tax=Desulfovibrio sp. UCD-KL4C TaxID=2578120 RepID=UPI0025B8A5C4|nr:pentapeptide repeat-containing protein [Desulfovibrio sp. UCD-KL4C]
MTKIRKLSKNFTCKLNSLKIFQCLSALTFFLFILTLCFWPEINHYAITLPQYANIKLKITLGSIYLSFIEAIVIVFFLLCGKKYWCKSATVSQDLFTNRINEALKQLSSEEIFVRISAISELRRIAKETNTQSEKIKILDTLCAFIRDHSQTTSSTPSITHSLEQENNTEKDCLIGKNVTASRNDIQIALKFITQNIDELELRSKYNLNLSGANLRGANLINANLKDANLLGTNLYDSKLQGAKLAGVFFSPDTFNGAYLTLEQCKELRIKDHQWMHE